MLHDLTLKKNIRTFSVSPENPTGKKGEGGKATPDVGTAGKAARDLGQGWKVNPYVIIPAGQNATLADIDGQGAIRHIWITHSSEIPRRLIFRIYFDGQKNPAVCVPLSDFFLNADDTDYRQISSLPICCNPNRAMNSYFEMPYFKGFRVELENIGDVPVNVYYQIDCEEKVLDPASLYFHAQFRRTDPIPYKEPYTVLDGIVGKGQYVGMYLHWGVKSNGWWGEGEVKFFIDGDTDFPTVCGTGTEDYICGAYDFDVEGKYVEFSTPYTGLSKVGTTDATYRSQRYFDMYRFHLNDPVYFEHDLKVTVQALGWRKDGRYRPLRDDISSVAFWYSDNLTDIYPPLPDRDELEL